MTVLQFNSHLLHELVARAGEDRDRRRRHQVSILQCALWLTFVCRKDRKTCCWVRGAISLHSHKHRADYYEVSNKVNAL